MRPKRAHLTIGVGVFGDDCVACQAAYHWIREGVATWIDEIARFCARGETNVYGENAFNALALKPLDVRGRLCSEIDDAGDLKTVSHAFAALRS